MSGLGYQIRSRNRDLTGIGGGAALFALQFACSDGAQVWVTSGSAEKIERAKALGAINGANYRDADWSVQLKNQAGLFDVIVDSAGGEGFASLIELTKPGGRIVFFGATVGNPQSLDLRRCFFRQISLLGSTMGSPADFAGMARLVEARKLVPVVDKVFPLDSVDDALHHLADGTHFGKVVLEG